MNIYCVKCKRKQNATNLKKHVSANGRHRVSGQCAVCGTKVSQFVSGNKRGGCDTTFSPAVQPRFGLPMSGKPRASQKFM